MLPSTNKTSDLLLLNMLPQNMVDIQRLNKHYHNGQEFMIDQYGQRQVTFSSLVEEACHTASLVITYFVHHEEIMLIILQYACELPHVGVAAGLGYKNGHFADLVLSTHGRLYANCGKSLRASHHGGGIPQSLYEHLQQCSVRSIRKWVVFASHSEGFPRWYRVAVLTNTDQVWIFGGKNNKQHPGHELLAQRAGLYSDIYLGHEEHMIGTYIGIYLVKKHHKNTKVFVPLGTLQFEQMVQRNFMMYLQGG